MTCINSNCGKYELGICNFFKLLSSQALTIVLELAFRFEDPNPKRSPKVVQEAQEEATVNQLILVLMMQQALNEKTSTINGPIQVNYSEATPSDHSVEKYKIKLSHP